MRRSAFGAFAFALLQLAAASCSLADDASVTTIDGTAGVRATGIVQVNVAAGNGNSASNVVAIGGVPVTKSRKPECVCATSTATASIGGDAFSGASGVVQINQISGSANAGRNTLTIGGSAPVLLDLAVLSRTRATATSAAHSASADAVSVATSSTTFSGASGVVQTNQIAGSGNSAHNDLSLTVSLPHHP